jgi:hypothetical protein
VLLVDAGDNFQGTIFYNAWKGSAEIMALNALGYDAVTLGNHEFDRGPAELGRALRGEPVEIAGATHPTEKPRPPIVATNVDAGAEPALRGLFAPSAVLERGGERFGILGVVTEDVPAISSPGPHVCFLDAVSSVQDEADRLQAAGIDKLILLSHCRLSGRSGTGAALARGGSHRVWPRSRPAGRSGSGGSGRARPGRAGQGTVSDRGRRRRRCAGAGGQRLRVGALAGAVASFDFDERGVIRRWEGRPMFVRGCAFVRGAVDCGRQSAPEDPVVKARVARLPRPAGPVRRRW